MSILSTKDFGLKGDGITDDTNAFRDLLGEAQLKQAAIVVDPGEYRITDEIVLSADNHVDLCGCGSQMARLVFDDCPGLGFSLYQHGIQQTRGVSINSVGLVARGACGPAIRISYGDPETTNDHYRGSVVLRNVGIESNDLGHWNDGITLRGVWNATLDNVFASGNPCGGVWNNMAGAGLRLEGLCVNTHISNSRFNFWATGIYGHGVEHNHEGIFCSNNSMVAVKRGVWLAGNPAVALAPRIHTFQWQGGMIENRAGGVVGGVAAFHLQHVWSASIQGCQMLTETLNTPEPTYGIIPQDCRRVMVSGCEVNAYTHGFLSTDVADGHIVNGNSFPNCHNRVVHTGSATNCIEANNT